MIMNKTIVFSAICSVTVLAIVTVAGGTYYYISHKDNDSSTNTSTTSNDSSQNVRGRFGQMTTYSGTVKSISDSSLTLTTDSAEKTITTGSSTTITKSSTVTKDELLKVGDNIEIRFTTNSDNSKTATAITTGTSVPVGAGNANQYGMPTNGAPSGNLGGTPPSDIPQQNGSNQQTGSDDNFRNRAMGKITAVTSTSVTIEAQGPNSSSGSTATYTLSDSTTYTSKTTVEESALVSGLKVEVQGTEQSGKITARSITITEGI
jgi:hypothetical protein